MTQSFNGNGAEAVHAETSSPRSAAIAAVNHGSAAGVFAYSDHGEGLHSEGSDGSAGVAAFGRGSGAGVFAKSLGDGPGVHAESSRGGPALLGVALGTGAGVYAKGVGGQAGFFEGNVHVTGTLSIGNTDLIGAINALHGQLNALAAQVAALAAATSIR